VRIEDDTQHCCCVTDDETVHYVCRMSYVETTLKVCPYNWPYSYIYSKYFTH